MIDSELLSKPKIFWNWFVDELTSLALACREHFAPPTRFILRLNETVWEVFTPEGTLLGSLVQNSAGFTCPAALRETFKGASVDVALPSGWLLRRALQPIATESLPFVDALARHQIERLTPWRVADTYFGVKTWPFEDDAAKHHVEVGVIAKSMVRPLLDFLRGTEVASLRLLVAGEQEADAFTIPVEGGGADDHAMRLRWQISLGVAGCSLLFVFVFGMLILEKWHVESAIETLDGEIAHRRALLQPSDDMTDTKGVTLQSLRNRRRNGPCLVGLLEDLSNALPDHAYLDDFSLEKGVMRISGLSSHVSELVPVLEGTPAFSEVGFTAATTREERGADRFHLQMRIVAQAGNRCS